MTLRLPPTEQLLAFKAVVELGSFTAAASELCVSQSAVSHQVARLERLMGQKLLRRTTRHLTLTTEGDRLFSAIVEPLGELSAVFENALPERQGGALKIQIETVFAATWLAPRLDDFLQRHPKLRLEQYRAADLRLADDMELAIRWGTGSWPGLESELVLSLQYVPVCSPSLLASSRLARPQDIQNHKLLHDRHYRDWQRWCEEFGVDHPHPRTGDFVDDSHILIELAVGGRGIALTSPLLIKRELASGSLVCPFPDMKLSLREAYHLVTRKGQKLSRNGAAFVDWLRSQSKS
jgi:LysR family transcriptional regulator, glycine cleavage system transcriptional activator